MGAVFYLIPSTKLIPLKALAEQLGITIVLIHHLRKAADNDPFNMISGSTCLNGCVDRYRVWTVEPINQFHKQTSQWVS